MDTNDVGQDGDVPEAARLLIAQQAAEIATLRAQIADEQFARELRDIFHLATVAGRIAAPTAHTRLPALILSVATRMIGAVAGSLFLVDEETDELVIEYAVGPKADEVRHLRLGPGQGVAGLVAATGQAIALTDAGRDARHASEVAERIGYQPSSILAVPLLSEDRVVGVLELLDKVGGVPFGRADIDALASFAEQAAIAVEQSRALHGVASLIGEVLHLVEVDNDDQARRLRAAARDFARRIDESPSYRRALSLGRMIREVADAGEAEAALCERVLSGVVEYLQQRPGPAADLWSLR